MIEIRKASREDLPGLALLEQESFSDSWSQSALEETLKNPLSCILIALWGKEVVGYCIFYQILDEVEIVRVAVVSEHRRKGIGEMLLQKLKNISLEQGVKKLLLDVREGNLAARALYEKQGFGVDGLRKRFYQNPTEDAVLMSCALP